MSTPAIAIRNVTKTYWLGGGGLGGRRPLTAVDDVTLSVEKGSVLGIVGESGCGKSTLAKMVMGLVPPTSGEVLVEGQHLADLHRLERARLIQLVPQDPYSSLNPRRRVRDNIALPLLAQGGHAAKAIDDQLCEAMERVGLRPDMGERYPSELSGGQRQRVAIARALLLRPSVIVCDEPTSALDVSVQAQILNMLVALRRDLALTLIFISHNLAVVEHIASEVAVMYLGRVVERKASRDLFHQPDHPYTQALLGSVLTPDVGLGVPDTGLGEVPPDPSNIPPGCRFHPRCRFNQAICATMPPRLSDGETAECHFAGRLPPSGPLANHRTMP